MRFTVLDGSLEETVDVRVDGGQLRAPVPADRVLLGWERKPEGWCRRDACIPARHVDESANGVDLTRFVAVTGRVMAADHVEQVIALADGGSRRGGDLGSGEAPAFTLPDVDGRPWSLATMRGRKVALVMWASWCGCRYDLPAWETQHAALAPYGFSVVSVALDRDPEHARPWIEEARATHPALVDADGVVADLYNVVNVPTVVWIDETGRLARPQDTQVATDTFRSLNGLSSEPALAALRRWAVDGDAGLTDADVRRHLRLPTEQDQLARAEARLGVWLLGQGRDEAAERHLEEAALLAPHDLTIRRGMMPLRGIDPMGDAYFRLRAELEAAGVPIYRPLPDWSARP